MKPRQKRFALVAMGLTSLGLAAWLVLSAFQDNLVFFFTPTQMLAGEAPKGKSFRIGGMVEEGSVKRQPDGMTVAFVITDNSQRVNAQYRGVLPDLFKEGKGVVAQGKLGDNQVFMADEVLAKHDENYMPPEAAYALKKGSDANLAAGTGTGTGAGTGAAAVGGDLKKDVK